MNDAQDRMLEVLRAARREVLETLRREPLLQLVRDGATICVPYGGIRVGDRFPAGAVDREVMAIDGNEVTFGIRFPKPAEFVVFHMSQMPVDGSKEDA